MYKVKLKRVFSIILTIMIVSALLIISTNFSVEAKDIECSTCNGTGKIKCTKCNGSGYTYISGPTVGSSIMVGCSQCSGRTTVPCTDCSGLGHFDDGTVEETKVTEKITVTKTTTVSKPKSTKLTSAKKKNKTTITLKWKKKASITGYQIQYSTSSKFKNSKKVTIKKSKTTSTNIKKLKKGKKYYFRIRTYKTVSGKKIYSSWSGKKSFKL